MPTRHMAPRRTTPFPIPKDNAACLAADSQLGFRGTAADSASSSRRGARLRRGTAPGRFPAWQGFTCDLPSWTVSLPELLHRVWTPRSPVVSSDAPSFHAAHDTTTLESR